MYTLRDVTRTGKKERVLLIAIYKLSHNSISGMSPN